MHDLRSGKMTTAQLMRRLEEVLHREQSLWQPHVYKTPVSQGAEIGPHERDQTVAWLAFLCNKFHFYPETFNLAVAILDRMLRTVKARLKYLRCIGIASLYLAAKTLEEDEVVPNTTELVEESGCGCSVSDVCRMELVILDKLKWDLNLATPLSFLHIFHALLLSSQPQLLDNFYQMTPARQLTDLTCKLQRVLCCHLVLGYRPAVIAVALLSLELELFLPDWLGITFMMQAMVQEDNRTIICCREKIASILGDRLEQSRLQYSNKPLRKTVPNRAVKRKVDQAEEDDIYDCIKSLYNDEATSNTTVAMVTCGREASRQEQPKRSSHHSCVAN